MIDYTDNGFQYPLYILEGGAFVPIPIENQRQPFRDDPGGPTEETVALVAIPPKGLNNTGDILLIAFDRSGQWIWDDWYASVEEGLSALASYAADHGLKVVEYVPPNSPLSTDDD